jgi:secretion/DNA translocation related CpaE-like protein
MDEDNDDSGRVRPLVVSTDDAVLDEVLRLAAAVGCEVEHAPDLVAARPRWPQAPLVILDEAAARSERLPPRRGVLLVYAGGAPEDLWERAFSLGVQEVVALPEDETALTAALADLVEGAGARPGRVVGVVGGRGGAGASVFAAAIGLTECHAGGRSLLVDCDPLGGGMDLLLGAELERGLRWPDLHINAGRVSMSSLRAALPGRTHRAGRLSVISCEREGPGPTGAAAAAVVDAGRRTGEIVVCDLPRHLDEAALAVVQRADLVVAVVPAEIRACAAARRVLDQVGDHNPALGVVVRAPAPDGLAADEIARALDVRLIAQMRSQHGLDKALERGRFVPRHNSSLGKAARAVLHRARATGAEQAVAR